MTIKETGLSDTVLEALGRYLSRKPCEVKVWNLIVQCDNCSLSEVKLFCIFCLAFSPIYSLIETGHSVNFGPAVSHLFCSGFTEI